MEALKRDGEPRSPPGSFHVRQPRFPSRGPRLLWGRAVSLTTSWHPVPGQVFVGYQRRRRAAWCRSRPPSRSPRCARRGWSSPRSTRRLARRPCPGATTKDLDQVAREGARGHDAKPNFLGYGGFPATICTSVNEVVVHGIPSDEVVLKDGDIISIDCGAIVDGWHGDAAYTAFVGWATRRS